MKLTLLSVFTLTLFGATALMLQDCQKLDPSNLLIKSLPSNATLETQRLAQYCRQCRRHDACTSSHGYNRCKVPWQKFIHICQCVAAVQQRPIYLIAGSVLESKNIAVALDHGANAIEIDATAWERSWWADQAGNIFSRGDSMEDLLKTIAKLVQQGRYIGFVWLQIRNPDYCNLVTHRTCAVNGLRDIVHRHLSRLRVPVLYGFPRNYNNELVGGGSDTADNLLPHEALAIQGLSSVVQHSFDDMGLSNERLRVITDGYFDWATGFWPWRDDIAQSVKSQAFQRVFAWTYAGGRTDNLDSMMDTGIDGIVYGFKHTAYYAHTNVRNAAQEIKQWINSHPHRARLATKGDVPW
ncbi:hypothetical protein CDD81_6468 [Ophiocordyceps australis]|uniref:Uncharacterized protein n=1 Tax=Ophiocordyceps australis TaxID=1399860 RepID=A0A2C5YI94_9HYPO|nr:hypothetical protein CDD81_6468 [Ophiocordyceps australis]